MELLSELIAWLRELDPVFAFLLALPFVVGAAGLAAEFRARPIRRARKASRPDGASQLPDRAAHAP